MQNSVPAVFLYGGSQSNGREGVDRCI